MATVRVTCPECAYSFTVAESRVGGLVTCRDCTAEFRLEFAEDDRTATEESPKPTVRKNAVSRPDLDSEPEEWKTDLPIRSPVPLLLVLAGLQVVVAGFLIIHWLFPDLGTIPTGPKLYQGYPATPTTARW